MMNVSNEFWIGIIIGAIFILVLMLIMRGLGFTFSNGLLEFKSFDGMAITGVLIQYPTMCIPMDQRNIEEIEKSIDHEYLHYLIDFEDCGNVTCYQHFCKDYANTPSFPVENNN